MPFCRVGSQEFYAQKRVVNHNREHGIKADDQAMEQRESTRFETARTTAMGARRNQSGEAFNIITANYTRNDNGQTLASKVGPQECIADGIKVITTLCSSDIKHSHGRSCGGIPTEAATHRGITARPAVRPQVSQVLPPGRASLSSSHTA